MVLFNYINPAYYAIAWTVIHAIWQISLIVLLTAGVQALLRNTSSQTRYFIWVSALMLILTSSIMTFIYYFTLDPGILLQTSIDEISLASEPGEALVHQLNVASADNPFTFQAITTYINANILVIVMIWLVGMVLAFIRLLGNIGYVEYLKNKFNFPVDGYWEEMLNATIQKMGIRRKVALLESALVMSPLVVGHLKPVIFFPMGAINRLSPEEVEAILAHELAHIMRHDYLINLVVSCVESFYYFHPAMWWLTSQIKTEREHCCDDLAIKATGRPLQYAQSLVAVQEMALTAPRLAMQFAGKEKKSKFFLRINRLIKPTANGSNVREKSLAAFITALLVIVVAMSSKPIDSAAHCLPSPNAGNETYLKFDGDEGTDSLALEFAINDGVYHYNDHYYHAEMEVVNRRVVSLILNGLKISGNDIKRFGNLIKEILLADQQTKVAGSGNSGLFYDTFASELIKDNLLTRADLNEISFNVQGLHINGKKQSESSEKKYNELYQRMKTKGMPDVPDFNIDIYPDEKGTVLQSNLIGENKSGAGTEKQEPSSTVIKSVEPIKNYGWRSVDDVFNDWLEEQLFEDGYITDVKSYHYVWTESGFVVDDEVVEKEDVERYQKKYKDITGMKMDLTFIRTRNVTRD
ncbi:MAG: M56 family metallopeptidase [Saprospiraceae bacterium]|nr:M56 family metallopeptidase [Saprospiraceae bacterium]